MATLQELHTALVNADRAGDTEAARAIAAEITRLNPGRYSVQVRAPAQKPDEYDPTSGMGAGERFGAGFAKGFVDAGRGIKQAVGAMSREDMDAVRKQDAPLMRTGMGTFGNVVGSAASLVPAAFAPGANTITGGALIGGITGALQPVGTEDSRLSNTFLGAGGGAVGNAAANTIGRTVRPIRSQLTPELEALAGKAESLGIPLDAADKTGSRPLKVLRSVMESMPITAARQAQINEAKRQAFNRAALETIGETGDKATPEVLNAARERIGQAFNDLSARNDVTFGNDFITAIAKIDASRNAFSSPKISEVVDKALDLASSGSIKGTDYQKVRSTLGKQARDAFSSGNSETGQALKSLQAALDDAATQSISQADRDAWRQARSQWQALKVLEKAAAPNSADAVAGNVSPAKLAGSMLQSDRKGFTYGTTNQAQLADLARVGQVFVKDQIPNSGTAERTFMQSLLENPIKALWNHGVGGAALPAQALINSKAGQAYLQSGLLQDNAKNRMIADLLRRGSFASGAASPAYLAE